jgi:hypothetical protein
MNAMHQPSPFTSSTFTPSSNRLSFTGGPKTVAKTKRPIPLPSDGIVDDRWLESLLYDSGEVLMSLVVKGVRPMGYFSVQLDTMPNVTTDYSDKEARLRRIPSPREISDMDAVLDWINDALYGASMTEVRRAIFYRMLVKPRTGRPLYPWRRLGEQLGCNKDTARGRWNDGVRILMASADRQARRRAA